MNQYEKVIKGLECYLTMRRGEKVECKMEYCPYWEEDDDTGLSLCNSYQIQADALDLLKAHEIATVEPKCINLTDETKAWLDKMDAVDALRNIADICMDWDGYRTVNGLGELVNEIWAYARYCADRLQKAQEPRVMTLEEAKSAFVIEYKSGKLREVGMTVLDLDIDPTNAYYGEIYRVWTSRPTDEQREAIPWN